MLDNKGFDLWADGYDKTVGVSDEENTYPFAGYKDVLGTIYKTIMKKANAVVLDIGFGTGTLTTKLYENGCTIYGQDFSARMIELASEKMPGAHLYQGDFTQGLVEPLQTQNYDYIVATYSLHHLTDEQKVSFLRVLRDHLNPGGQILIGDVAFETRSQLEQCRKDVGDEWDEEEIYFVVDELKKDFPSLAFEQVSYCAGILSLAFETNMKQIFESDKISFVEVSECLVNDYLTMVNDYENVNRFIGGKKKSFTVEQELKWVQKKLEEKAIVFSMIDKASGRFIGNIELMDPNDSEGELGIAITAEMQDQGHGTEAVLAMVNYAIDHLGLKRVFLRTNPQNARAIRVYEKCGFRKYKQDSEHVYMEVLR